MQKLIIKTQQKKQVLDITEKVNEALSKGKVSDGVCHLFLTHTTCSLSTAVMDPGTDLDMLEAYDAMVPDLNYRHPHDPTHVPDHILSTMMGTSLCIPFKKSKVITGLWQKVVLFEFDGPRERQIIVSVTKTE
ncbi:MAG: YjbQ family protein [Candidatus Wildermuthbacteria bacterium]|nr:YjbQ family protein [Candidatus Wildermuthbacteria bacterium]